MAKIFISYRRSTSRHLARLLFNDLRARGHDVFLDVNTIDSGAFDRIILSQIAAREHFLLILSEGALERCANEGDWLRREIEEAFRLKRNIIPIFDEGFNIEREKAYLPEYLREELPRLNAPPYSHYYYDAFIDTIDKRFLHLPEYVQIEVTPTPEPDRAEVQRRINQAVNGDEELFSAPDVSNILPEPFAWCAIPAGEVTLAAGGYVPGGGKAYPVEHFYMAKYPITNAQYDSFVADGGYDNPEYWIELGWQLRQKYGWQDRNATEWRWGQHPVIGVSWYEAMAFCSWLNTRVREQVNIEQLAITLPTEQQWQRAAQGNDHRIYPWGNHWDVTRCNSKNAGLDKTTPVAQYEGKADSPYGVVDMVGNVWEWCQTSWELNNPHHADDKYQYILRGGSFKHRNTADVTTIKRGKLLPTNRDNNRGFRIAFTTTQT